MDYSSIISNYIRALNIEIKFLKESGGRKYRVFNITKLEKEQDGYIYVLESDTELFLADSFPVRLEIKGRRYAGEIVAIDGFSIWIATKQDLGDTVDIAYLTCEPWNILDALVKRLNECKNGERSGLSNKLIEAGPKLAEKAKIDKIIKGQDSARQHTQKNDITVIWGPPGTGKTYTLSQIALDYMEKGKRVLICSHSNVSVDGAINSILKLVKEQGKEKLVKKGKILRYGYVRDKELSENEYATSYNYVLTNNNELKIKKDKIDKELEECKNNSNKLSDMESVRNKRKELMLILKEKEKESVCDANIVATTISKVSMEAIFYSNINYDVVIFDESSMAYVPQLIYASSLAKSKFICLGDFRQLAPIAQSNDSSGLLSKDIYSFLNIDDELGGINYHPWLVLLDQQRRMHPSIASFVNKNIYKNLIDSTYVKKDKTINEITHFAPYPGENLVFVDTSGTYNVCSKNTDNSRFNYMSALVTVKIALEASKNKDCSVGIITPYSAQSRLIKGLLLDFKATNIACSTVHQFQGSERDMIIFDVVESYPSSQIGILMKSNSNNNINRLINVALTRARGKFIIVANWGYWYSKLNDKNHIIMKLFDYMIQNGKNIRDDDFTKDIVENSNGSIKSYIDSTCYEIYKKDILRARFKLCIIIPECQIVNNDFIDVIKTIKDSNLDVTIKVKNKYNMPLEVREHVKESENAIYSLTIIDDKYIWHGLPFIHADFVMKNSTRKIKRENYFRIRGEQTANIINSLTGADYIKKDGIKEEVAINEKLQQNGLKKYIEEHEKCVHCGGVMTLTKSRKYHLKCKECKKTNYLLKETVELYILRERYTCPTHGSSVHAKLGKYGVFVQCMCGEIIDLGDL